MHDKMGLKQWKENALNKLAVAIVVGLIPSMAVLVIFLVYIQLFSYFYPEILIYLSWMLYFDRHAPLNGRERKWNWWRSLWFFKRFPLYFPQEMIKTAELPPDDNNYLLCMFPHGVFPVAPVANFGPTTGQFYELFPGLDVTFHALDSNFTMAIARELVLGMGFASCTQKAILHHLNKPIGHASLLMPGGIAEGLVSEPGHHRVVLKSHKGFIRVGLLAGTNLVPIYSFGESDLFYQKVLREGDCFFKAHQYARKKWRVPLYLSHGVGLFQNYFGILPRKLPVYTVVGAPLKLPKIENVTESDIDYWHGRFVEELVKLFDKHKHEYVENSENKFLEIE